MTGDVSAAATLGSLWAQAAAFEALLLVASAAHKVLRWARTREVVMQFGGVPEALATAALASAVAVEIGAAVMLSVPETRMPGALCALGAFGLYLGLIARALAQGRREADCGCSFGTAHSPLGAFQVGRNGVLMVLAAGVAWSATDGAAAIEGSQWLAAAAFMALYGAMDQVMGLRPLRRGEVA